MVKVKSNIKLPVRYLPSLKNIKDAAKQVTMLMKSRRLYKKGKYYTRKSISSYKSKPSSHIKDAERIYNISSVTPNKELAQKTGCSINALKKIVKKGEGAYFSSGSRPNQTAQSWGLARLASSITAGKSAAVDYNILEQGCDHKKKAFKLAQKSKRKYKFGHSSTKRRVVSLP
jgi:hypothetical protein